MNSRCRNPAFDLGFLAGTCIEKAWRGRGALKPHVLTIQKSQKTCTAMNPALSPVSNFPH